MDGGNMSRFYTEDLVALESDPIIVGIVVQTWSDVDPEYGSAQSEVYFHKDLPRAVKREWIENAVLKPKYVIIGFMNDGDGYCLIGENSLRLVDRSQVVGDVVKRKSSDHQSGIVISTSMQCRIRPCCTLELYRDLVELGNAEKRSRSVSSTKDLQCTRFDMPQTDLSVPSSGLKHWNTYREDDFILYKDCVGQVIDLVTEVTIRLKNGSVVTVEDALELEEPFFYDGSRSLHMAQHLHTSGYRARKKRTNNNVVDYPTDGDCHPGQIVRTKKANLRRGRWKFGSYNPNIEPYGIVVDVRCVALEMEWLFPNPDDSWDPQRPALPPAVLNTDDLEMSDIVVYDRNKPSENAIAPHLPQASYSPDIGFGNLVRLRKEAHTTEHRTQRGSSLHSGFAHEIPRIETQGFDMNVYQVSHTATQALILWQDGTMSEEKTVSVDPYENADEHDVWPGERVSYLPSEEQVVRDNKPHVRLSKVGIVQSVHSSRRTANIRWCHPCQVFLNAETGSFNDDISRFVNAGNLTISDEITEVSLYEIKVYPALDIGRGSMVLVCPDEQSMNDTFSLQAHRTNSTNSTTSNPVPLKDSFGEVVDLCLDGDIVVRFSSSSGAPELKVPMQRVACLSSGDTRDDDQEDFASNLDGEDSEEEDSEGEEDSDETWETDDEFQDATENVSSSNEGEAEGKEMEDDDEDHVETAEDRVKAALARTAAMFSPPSKPAKMVVLPDDAPQDHHFIRSTTQPLNGNFIGRVAKEQNILFSALPEGIFARTWENRLDLLRILIVGPTGTPYEHAPFVVDMHYPSTFPATPPDTFFHSWTNSVGKINPNLYEDGTICLSLLGTWHADGKRENWSPTQSSVLQIIMSILGLVLVEEPYYNEAGFEALVNTPESFIPSALYSEKAYILSKVFIKTALSAPPGGLGDVINWLYKDDQGPQLLNKVIADSKQMQLHLEGEEKQEQGSESPTKKPEGWADGKISTGAMILLKKNLEWLEGYKANVDQMEGVE